ncbi:MAG: NAD(P)-binding protein [Actinomycetota bacterium]|nr:NAD(P)-binding protein [Actinomycetota bacterium]
MREIETDYLVVGAGASGVAFVDTLLSLSDDVRVMIVDREERPGGHWLHAYPFVRLHQPSAYYGVRRVGSGRTASSQTGRTRGPMSGPPHLRSASTSARRLTTWWPAVGSRFSVGRSTAVRTPTLTPSCR